MLALHQVVVYKRSHRNLVVSLTLRLWVLYKLVVLRQYVVHINFLHSVSSITTCTYLLR